MFYLSIILVTEDIGQCRDEPAGGDGDVPHGQLKGPVAAVRAAAHEPAVSK